MICPSKLSPDTSCSTYIGSTTSMLKSLSQIIIKFTGSNRISCQHFFSLSMIWDYAKLLCLVRWPPHQDQLAYVNTMLPVNWTVTDPVCLCLPSQLEVHNGPHTSPFGKEKSLYVPSNHIRPLATLDGQPSWLD